MVFVSYDSSRDLDRALASLASTAPAGVVDAVVVENGRDVDSTRAMCERHGCRLVVPGRNLGYGAAANLAARECGNEYLAVANPDVVFLRDTVRLLLEFMDANPGAGVVAPQFLYPDGSPHPSARRKPALRYALAGRRSPLARWLGPGKRAREFQYLGSETRTEPMPVDAVVGALMLFRRRAFDAVGGFDERYFMFAEDIDICLRLAPCWGVYLVPQARLVHAVGGARRGWRTFTEFHRLRSLRRLYLRTHRPAAGPAISFGFACYLGTLMALGLLGLGEHEPTWQAGRLS